MKTDFFNVDNSNRVTITTKFCDCVKPSVEFKFVLETPYFTKKSKLVIEYNKFEIARLIAIAKKHDVEIPVDFFENVATTLIAKRCKKSKKLVCYFCDCEKTSFAKQKYDNHICQTCLTAKVCH